MALFFQQVQRLPGNATTGNLAPTACPAAGPASLESLDGATGARGFAIQKFMVSEGLGLKLEVGSLGFHYMQVHDAV